MRKSSSLVLVALLAAVGCAPSNPGIDIEGLAVGSDACSFAPSDTYSAGSLLDTSSISLGPNRPSIRLVAAIQVANRFMNRGNYVYPLMADPNTWTATEAEVELRGVDGAALGDLGLPARFRVPVGGAVVQSASGATEPGRGIVFVEVIPAVYGDALLDREGTIVVAVRLTGTTAGDSTQQTGEFTFPVTLCNGCLRQCIIDDATCMEAANRGCLSIGQDSGYSACTDAELAAALVGCVPM